MHAHAQFIIIKLFYYSTHDPVLCQKNYKTHRTHGTILFLRYTQVLHSKLQSSRMTSETSRLLPGSFQSEYTREFSSTYRSNWYVLLSSYRGIGFVAQTAITKLIDKIEAR